MRNFIPAHFGHADVRDNQVGDIPLAHPVEAFERIVEPGAVVLCGQVHHQYFADRLFVVENQNPFLHYFSSVQYGV